ncbi:CbrC family protein [Hamadaea sp. NPDC051192]|uniref:CbrC family protein n=1 Tax=Hamadaea sp. NPDC051192 TaxID=3154940 RepID=UPI003433EBE8
MPTEPEITFPLYAADLTTTAQFADTGKCMICSQHAVVCFRLGIGTAIICTCASCGEQTALASVGGGAEDAFCVRCEQALAINALPADPVACGTCLRAGKVAITKDTEFGMVRWEDAMAGRTHGVPGHLTTGGLPTAPTEDDWTSVLVDPAILLDLVRTPTYNTWQGEQWLFCCRHPMVYIGEWSQPDLGQHSDDDLTTTFMAVFDDAEPWVLQFMPANPTQDADWGFYVFRCRLCDKVRGHFDMT